MKNFLKLLGVCLITASIVGCAEVDSSMDSTQTLTGNQISLSVGLNQATKVNVADNWSLSWAEEDDLLLFSTTTSDSSVLAMDVYGEKTSTFTGTIPTGVESYRLATPSSAFSSVSTSTASVDLSEQHYGLNNTYMVGNEVIEAVDGIPTDVYMSHVGAVVLLDVTVENAPSSSNYVITDFELCDVPTKATIAMDQVVGSDDFYVSTTTGNITVKLYDADNSGFTASDDDDSASSDDSDFAVSTEGFTAGQSLDTSVTTLPDGIPATESSFSARFNVLPFTIADKITLTFNYITADGDAGVITAEVEASGTLARATYNTIKVTIDFAEFDKVLSFPDAPSANTTTLTDYVPSSLSPNQYYPITLKSTSSGTNPTTSQTKTRILEHMPDFDPDYSFKNYKSSINKYGSRIDFNVGATGRYYTKKIDERWWLVDPEGYLNIQRGLTSVTHDQGNEIAGAYDAKWGNVSSWLTDVYADFDDLGFNATGAFCKDDDCGYTGLMAFNGTVDNPLTVAPSFGFLSAFRKSSYNNIAVSCYPDGSTDNDDLEAGLAFYDGWDDFCVYYVENQLATYTVDPNVIGFFSDNELKWNGYSLCILTQFLKLSDTTNPAYIAAAEFMVENGKTASTSNVTDALSEAFAGVAAEAYYSGIRKALDQLGYEILYLGTRLHGTPKQIHAVIEAAAASCDIISINYYSNWSVAHDGSYSAQGSSSFVYNSWERVDKPFMVTEFYVKGADMSSYGMSNYVDNSDGAGWVVTDQLARGCWYQHFTLGLLESSHCVGWHWFRYQDDESANRGFYDRNYNQWSTLARYAKGINYNIYSLIDHFEDNKTRKFYGN